MNIRHELDPARREDATARAIKRLEHQRDQYTHLWRQNHPLVESHNQAMEKAIQREREYYSTVRIIEKRSGDSGIQFMLVYGDVDDNTVTEGTGPFGSRNQAAEWFYALGR